MVKGNVKDDIIFISFTEIDTCNERGSVKDDRIFIAFPELNTCKPHELLIFYQTTKYNDG